jgi:hypothetical protein
MSLHNQAGPATPTTADEILDLIIRHLPDLWHAQHRSRSRPLRAVLNATERVLQQRGDEVGTKAAEQLRQVAK